MAGLKIISADLVKHRVVPDIRYLNRSVMDMVHLILYALHVTYAIIPILSRKSNVIGRVIFLDVQTVKSALMDFIELLFVLAPPKQI
jgi:hypothetical protein